MIKAGPAYRAGARVQSAVRFRLGLPFDVIWFDGGTGNLNGVSVSAKPARRLLPAGQGPRHRAAVPDDDDLFVALRRLVNALEELGRRVRSLDSPEGRMARALTDHLSLLGSTSDRNLAKAKQLRNKILLLRSGFGAIT